MRAEFIIRGEGWMYPRDAECFDTVWDIDDPEYIAEDAARHYYENNDGWEDNWPVFFELYQDGVSIGVFEVGLEFDPTFSASPYEAEK